MYKVTLLINKDNFQTFENLLFTLGEVTNFQTSKYVKMLYWAKQVVKRQVSEPSTSTLLVYLDCFIDSISFVHLDYGWNPITGEHHGVVFNEFTETDFPKIFKALELEFPFESYQIYLINKELNGN